LATAALGFAVFDLVADLPIDLKGVTTVRHERETAAGFRRVTTEFHLHGVSETGRGEDVTYDEADHADVPAAELGLEGRYTLAEFSAALDDRDLFVGEPEREASRHYRRWAIESAALDLGLRQVRVDLGEALERSFDPVRFVVSPSLRGDDPDLGPVESLLEAHPGTELKLDPTPDWDADLIDALVATDAVRVLDLKGHYEDTEVDNPADPALYERVLDAFPDAVIEDPRFTDDTRDLLDANADRLSWDYPITGVDAVEACPVEPRWLNVKPSRFGTVESLLETVAYCAQADIVMYGGGQFELGVGRGQIQALAALLYPDGPNDVAPRGYNDPRAGRPTGGRPPNERTGSRATRGSGGRPEEGRRMSERGAERPASRAADLPESPLDVEARPGFGRH
jgi:hypothetical protein